jgi:hypothetical protein
MKNFIMPCLMRVPIADMNALLHGAAADSGTANALPLSVVPGQST